MPDDIRKTDPELEQVNSKLRQLVDVDRRVINRKQTIGYMLFDGSRDFNIDGHKELFVDSILKISLPLQSKYNIIAGAWDVIDDLLVGGIIEKTRTRWGKFVPYIFLGGIPLAIISTVYWLLPIIFSPEHINNFEYLPKFVAFAALDMLFELFSNFKNVAIGGYISTITPYPSDRRRLLAISSYFSIIYSRIPDLIIEFMLDFIKNGIVKSATRSTADMIKASMLFVGPFTAIVSGIIISWYCKMAKERVHQRIETAKVWQSLKTVVTNRPILMYMLSNALGSFGTGLTTNDYYRQVLNMTTFETIAGIPSFFFQPIGFSKYNYLTTKFSTRSLYMVSHVFAKTFYIPIFFYGMFLKDKNGNRFFTKRIPMLPVTAVWEIIYAIFWGVRSLSEKEISNECNDYIEWKYGMRNEATLSVASTIICKIPARLNGVLQPKYKEWINYDQTAYTEGRRQPERAEKWIFAMATIIPAFLVLSSMIPMFWYNINKEQRDKMYRELNERRVRIAENLTKFGNEDGVQPIDKEV